MSVKACCSFILAVMVIFVDGASLNSFWQVFVALSFASPLFMKLDRNCHH